MLLNHFSAEPEMRAEVMEELKIDETSSRHVFHTAHFSGDVSR